MMSPPVNGHGGHSPGRERLKVTLRSIGDGVIVTEVSGRISMMNDVASELTGWDEEDAAGRRLEEFLRLINEKSREPCTNPVDQVMSSGTVVDLANHTILIASDGTERLIADSAAPIHDHDGRVVLVFRDITEKRRREEGFGSTPGSTRNWPTRSPTSSTGRTRQGTAPS